LNTLVTFLLALAPYLAPPIIAALVVLVKSAIDKLPANKRPFVADIVKTTVAAVEKMAADQLNGPGKKQMAIELVDAQLKHFGMEVPLPVTNALIEEAVLLLKMPSVVVVHPAPVAVDVSPPSSKWGTDTTLPGKASPKA